MARLALLGLLVFVPGTGAWTKVCGFRPDFDGPQATVMAGSRIVGGTEALPGEWPWVVSIQTQTYHFCGGAIIHPWWVLSACHCFQDTKRNQNIRVAAGSTFLGISNASRWVETIFCHPLYNPKTYDNDIALLLLQKPIPYSIYHNAVCLPDSAVVPDDEMWENCVVAGWGLTKAGTKKASFNLLKAQVPQIPLSHAAMHGAPQFFDPWPEGGGKSLRATQGLLCFLAGAGLALEWLLL